MLVHAQGVSCIHVGGTSVQCAVPGGTGTGLVDREYFSTWLGGQGDIMGDVRDCFLRSNSEADSDSAWSAIPREMNQLPKRAGRDDFHLSILRLPFPVSQSPARGLQQEHPTSSSPCVQTQYTMHESSSPVVRPSVHLYTSHPTEVPAHAPFCATSSPPLSSVYTLLRLPYTCLGTRLVPRRTRHSTPVHKARRSPSNSVSSHQRSPRSCSKTCHSGTRSFLEKYIHTIRVSPNTQTHPIRTHLAHRSRQDSGNSRRSRHSMGSPSTHPNTSMSVDLPWTSARIS